MALAITVVLALMLAGYIGYPFYQSRRRRLSFAVNHRAENLEARKSEIYSAIKDIEFDFQMGKLSEADFAELKAKYKNEAVNLLQEIDSISGHKNRSSKQKSSEEVNYCSECGSVADEVDRFCASCGEPLR